MPHDLDELLSDWPYQPRTISARLATAADGRDVLQMRVDMGMLQMECAGRPDGTRPGGAETYLDHLLQEAFHRSNDFALDQEHCEEIDRELSQFYQRRICWLAVRHFDRVVQDASHGLALLDFAAKHRVDERWHRQFEQTRPLAIYHRAQAAALAHLEKTDAESAIEAINTGCNLLEPLATHDPAEQHDMLRRLQDLQDWIRDQYQVDRTLSEQLAAAIAAEQYEQAARLRDEIARRNRP